MAKKQKEAPSIPHKSVREGICFCHIGIDHNTKSSPHKDRDGMECRDSFRFETPEGSVMAGRIRFARRSCHACGRGETYSPTEVVVVFQKGTSAIQAREFILNFKIAEHTATIIDDPAQNIIEKNGIVAYTLSIATAAGKSVDEWIHALEDQETVWFVSPRMITSYPDVSVPPPPLPPIISEQVTEDRKPDSESPPDELQNT